MRLARMALGTAVLWCGCGEAPLDADDDVTAPLSRASETVGAAPELASAADQAPPGVAITGVTTGGSGCAEAGSLEVLIASDGTSLLVIFDEMNIAYPPGPPVQHLNCVANVKLDVPDGWRFSVQTATTRGYAYLSSGHSARIDSKYFFSGSPPGGMKTSKLQGPFDDDYAFTDDVTPAGSSKCGGQAIFHLHTKLTLDVGKNKDEPAYLNASTADARLVKELHWKWTAC